MTTSPTPCRCGPDGCADSSCPGRTSVSEAERMLDVVQALLDDPLDYCSYTIAECRVLQAELRRLAAVECERDMLMETLRDEMDENLRLRELGGAGPDENITAMTERLIRELEAHRLYARALCKAVDAATDFAGTVAGGASWWDDVWADHAAALDRARERISNAQGGEQ